MTPHPLDPLSAEDIRQAAAVLRRDCGVGERWRFASIELREPPKGESIPRLAEVICWNRDDGRVYKARVDLAGDRVISWDEQPDGQPNMTVDEFHECDHVLRSDPRVIEALAARGITDMDHVLIDTWAYGAHLVPEQHRGGRIGWADVWYRRQEGSSPYANPVTGLHFVVDLNAMELLEVEDTHRVDEPTTMGEYLPHLVPGQRLRDDIRPLEISQPEGTSFTLDGNELRWQNWSMRLGFNFREGPVIYQVAFDDQGTRRDIAYRMSFAEMVVPYRDPGFDHYRRTAFDIGEWGLGYMTTSLELGCDCLGEIVYVDAVVPDSRGEPIMIERAVCLHEEDNAVLWKHVDSETGAEVRRMRRMVVSAHVTVANYEYLVYWRFYQDGNIECEIRATGLMVTTPMQADSDSSPYGTTVDRRTYAPFHQHFVVAKLDLDIDGEENTVVEVDSVAASIGDGNPYGLALSTQTTTIESESQAARDFNWETQRSWKVINPNKTNRHGSNTAYKLVPGAAIPALLDSSSPVYQRAPVIGHCVWVTAFNDNERWPAGDYPTQSSEDTGITRWITDDAPLVGTDVVLWYVFGIHHITRAEDWPIMPVDIISFWLKPFGFFDRNPALDAPSVAGAGGHSHPEHSGR